jgi:hypothetical protein
MAAVFPMQMVGMEASAGAEEVRDLRISPEVQEVLEEEVAVYQAAGSDLQAEE